MANITSAWGGVVVPDATENVDVPTDLLAMSTSFESKVLGVFANTAARDAAHAAIPAGTKTFAYITGTGCCVFNGTDWEWVGSASPQVYTFGTGLGPVWSLGPITVFSAYPSATFNFTPVRTGWADITFSWDVSQVFASAFGAAYVRPKFNPGGGAGDTLLGDRVILIAGNPRTTGEIRIPARVKLILNQVATLSVDVSSFAATPAQNQWQLGSFVWTAVQQ